MGNYLFAIAVYCLLAFPAFAQESAGEAPAPSTHVRDWFSLNLRSKIQFDFGGFRPDVDDNGKVLEGRRLRFGVDGTVLRDLDYTFLVDTAKGQPELRDAFVKYRRLGKFQVQAGRFKIPFGLDRLTDSGDLNFVERSRIGTLVAPGRDVGTMVSGDVLERRLHYSAGVFQHDGKTSQVEDFAAIGNLPPGGSLTLAGRAAFALATQGSTDEFRNIRAGVAFARTYVPAGLSSLPGLTVSNQTFFPRMYVNGARQRWGAELRWQLKSLLLQSELMDVRDERRGQGLHGEDLSPLRTRGWYVSAVHPLFGHVQNGGGGFLSSILPGMHLGLFEATARYEVIRFGSTSSAGFLPTRNPRAENVIGNDDHVWTLGINWRANRYIKFQLNGVREMLRDPARTPIDGENRYVTLIGRAQLFF